MRDVFKVLVEIVMMEKKIMSRIKLSSFFTETSGLCSHIKTLNKSKMFRIFFFLLHRS